MGGAGNGREVSAVGAGQAAGDAEVCEAATSAAAAAAAAWQNGDEDRVIARML